MLPLAKNYRLSSTPQFDAVEDVKEHFGKGWDAGISIILNRAARASAPEFIQTCWMLQIIDPFQIKSLYELYKGGNKWGLLPIHHGLVEAFRGVNEDDWKRYHSAVRTQRDRDYEMTEVGLWVEEMTIVYALGAAPKVKLETYLQWNGILGYTETIWEIAMGEV